MCIAANHQGCGSLSLTAHTSTAPAATATCTTAAPVTGPTPLALLLPLDLTGGQPHTRPQLLGYAGAGQHCAPCHQPDCGTAGHGRCGDDCCCAGCGISSHQGSVLSGARTCTADTPGTSCLTEGSTQLGLPIGLCCWSMPFQLLSAGWPLGWIRSALMPWASMRKQTLHGSLLVWFLLSLHADG